MYLFVMRNLPGLRDSTVGCKIGHMMANNGNKIITNSFLKILFLAFVCFAIVCVLVFASFLFMYLLGDVEQSLSFIQFFIP